MNCKCGNSNPPGAHFCTRCGATLAGTPTTGTRDDQVRLGALVYPRNPPLSPHLCWVNIAVSGLAQIIYGQTAKGVTLLVVTLASNLILPFLLAMLIGAFSIYDAWRVGRALQKGRTVGKWEFLPPA